LYNPEKTIHKTSVKRRIKHDDSNRNDDDDDDEKDGTSHDSIRVLRVQYATRTAGTRGRMRVLSSQAGVTTNQLIGSQCEDRKSPGAASSSH